MPQDSPGGRHETNRDMLAPDAPGFRRPFRRGRREGAGCPRRAPPHAAQFQRHLDRGIVAHGCPSVLMLGPITGPRSTSPGGAATSQKRPRWRLGPITHIAGGHMRTVRYPAILTSVSSQSLGRARYRGKPAHRRSLFPRHRVRLLGWALSDFLVIGLLISTISVSTC
jgi:hypothetical protein